MTMTPDALREAVGRGEIDTVIVCFTDPYGRLLGKRLDAGFFCDEAMAGGAHACDYLLTVDMEMEPVTGYAFASWDQGYGDVHLVPDLATLRHAAWTDATALVLCDVHHHDGTHASVAPRSVLRRQVERLAAHDLTARAGSELEFYLYDDSYRDAAAAGYHDLRPAGWYVEDYHLLQGGRVEGYVGAARRALNGSGIPVESSKGEWGRGQHEINVRHAEILDMADRHTTMKHALKELADAHGVSVSFMAKPHTDAAGSSSHLHLSLWDRHTGTNALAGDGDPFRWFLGGWLAHVPDFMVCYAPTVNSYKRFVDGSWAPTRISWAPDNRTVGFRVVGSGSSRRIECRIPGADCNPYLAYAAALASGLAGIEQRIEPAAAVDGDAYGAAELPRVARTLVDAVAAFDRSEVARAAFGDEVVDHYVHFHRTELDWWQTTVTDIERARYFERI